MAIEEMQGATPMQLEALHEAQIQVAQFEDAQTAVLECLHKMGESALTGVSYLTAFDSIRTERPDVSDGAIVDALDVLTKRKEIIVDDLQTNVSLPERQAS